jgi:iron complex transport system ATP-binding protein
MSSVVLRALTVHRGGVPVVRDLHLELTAGSWTMVVGPNGAGKSSLINAMAGVLGHDGSLLIDGVDVRELSVKARARLIAVVPQRPELPTGMTVGEYVMLGRTAHRSAFASPRKTDHQRVASVIERLDLGWLVARPVTSLSGGELQRATIARAMAQEATVVLLDEPTSALDIRHQHQALELVDQLRHDEGLTICSAMHDLTLAAQFGDQVALLACGELMAVGDAASVLTEARLGQAYGASVVVRNDPEVGLVVIPRRVR